ncbi:MAG: hypothetical protein GEU83_02840 [Pseudonocardiaceae bacterium]|nr:hypothetical protein [Pseudonocardiaceae bacterium]
MRTTLAAPALAGLLLLAGCGTGSDPGVASVSGDASAAPTSAAPQDPADAALAYGRCMRENGVPDFPDPEVDADGRVRIEAGVGAGGPIDPAQAPALEAALEACDDILPTPDLSEEDEARLQDAALAYARCMRDNGVPDFPDPDFTSDEGGFHVGPDDSGVNLDDPAFRAADDVCHHHLGQARSGGGDR